MEKLLDDVLGIEDESESLLKEVLKLQPTEKDKLETEKVRKLVIKRLATVKGFAVVHKLVKNAEVKVYWYDLQGRSKSGGDLRGKCYPSRKVVIVDEYYRGKPASLGILLHELIHAVGGKELDAEFFENVLCPTKEEGGVPPGPSDFKDFWKRKVGKFVGKPLILKKNYVKISYGGKTIEFYRN